MKYLDHHNKSYDSFFINEIRKVEQTFCFCLYLYQNTCVDSEEKKYKYFNASCRN